MCVWGGRHATFAGEWRDVRWAHNPDGRIEVEEEAGLGLGLGSGSGCG